MSAPPTVNHADAVRLLESLAHSAKTLAQFAMEAAERAGGHDMDFYAIQAMAKRIGIVADWAAGGGAVGDPLVWAAGPWPQAGGVA